MITIRWHGHACFEIADDVIIVTDPHDGSSIGIAPPAVKADIVLVSHDHYDHNKIWVVEKDGSEIIKRGVKSKRIANIRGVKAYHDKDKGSRRGEITIFTFTLDGLTFCHLGDLGHMLDEVTLNELGDIDILFVPVGGVFTLDGREALEICRKIQPKVIVPMHYKISGLSLPIERVDDFLAHIEGEYPVRYVANEIEIEKEDLSSEGEVWIFTL
jgi:L-ascorbate metabolism protein UlaG (beta-lactamase superfamily)